jgi:GDP-mannose 6-dehydrogenase
MNVSVFGLGYVGCVTAACLARDGHQVIGVDVSADKVAMINDGRSPIVEPGLEPLVKRLAREGRLSATTSATDAVADSDLALICVGTPDIGHGQPDLEALSRVADAIGQACAGRTRPFTVVIRSTVLPGTNDLIRARLMARLRDDATARQAGEEVPPVSFASNPEFMREGCSIRDFDHPPFVLIGSDDVESAGVLRALYASVDAQVVQTSIRSAEMIKYVCNAYHALKVCFANEIADVCDALGADAQEVMRIFRMDHKLNISEAYLTPGFAFGGSCLPKDVRAMLCAGRIHAVDVPLLASILPSNEGQIRHAIDHVLQLKKRKIGVVGLAFKPDTDDLRESPMVTLVETLIGKGCDVRILDPNVVMARLRGANRTYIENEIPHIASLLCESADDLVQHADVIVIGAKCADAEQVLLAARPGQTIVDLTRGVATAAASIGEGKVWAAS